MASRPERAQGRGHVWAKPARAPQQQQQGGSGGTVITTTITYQYDPLYRLTSATYSSGAYYDYTYDAAGNRLSERRESGVVITYTYDIANRLIASTGVTYTWDANGNLLNDGASTYAYDSANRLVAVSGQGSAYSFAYNGLGDRVSQTVNGVPTNYVLDLNAGLTQVLSDGANAYLYGNGRIGEQQPSGFAYHLADALGSVRQVADATGSVTLAKGYEPYGSVRSSAGSGASAYGFTGEQQSGGLVFLRARYYVPYLNQFIQPDPIVPDPTTPQAWNRYVYVNNNPINWTDPSGRITCKEMPWECDANGNWLTEGSLPVSEALLIVERILSGDCNKFTEPKPVNTSARRYVTFDLGQLRISGLRGVVSLNYNYAEVTKKISKEELGSQREFAIAVRLIIGEVGADRLVANKYGIHEGIGILNAVRNRLNPDIYDPESRGVRPYSGCGESGSFTSCVVVGAAVQYPGILTQRGLNPRAKYKENILGPVADRATIAYYVYSRGVDNTNGATEYRHRCGPPGSVSYNRETYYCDKEPNPDDIPGSDPYSGPLRFLGPKRFLPSKGFYGLDYTGVTIDYSPR
jgi:RHS repeat-associated protein